MKPINTQLDNIIISIADVLDNPALMDLWWKNIKLFIIYVPDGAINRPPLHNISSVVQNFIDAHVYSIIL